MRIQIRTFRHTGGPSVSIIFLNLQHQWPTTSSVDLDELRLQYRTDLSIPGPVSVSRLVTYSILTTARLPDTGGTDRTGGHSYRRRRHHRLHDNDEKICVSDSIVPWRQAEFVSEGRNTTGRTADAIRVPLRNASPPLWSRSQLKDFSREKLVNLFHVNTRFGAVKRQGDEPCGPRRLRRHAPRPGTKTGTRAALQQGAECWPWHAWLARHETHADGKPHKARRGNLPAGSQKQSPDLPVENG